LDVLQLDTVGVHACVSTGAGALEGKRHTMLALNRHPPNLNVAEEHHAGRTPVYERVWKDVRIHERAPGLACAKLSQLAVGMPEAECRLALINAGSEQFELERRLQVPQCRRRRGSYGEAALPPGRERAVVVSELVFDGRQASPPHRVEPVRVD